MKNLLNNKYFSSAAVFSFLKPAGLDFMGYDTLNMAINIARVVFAFIIFFIYFSKFGRFSLLHKAEFLFFGSLIFSTIYNDENLNNVLIFAISILAFTSMVELYGKGNFPLFVKVLFFNYFTLLSVNLLYMVSILGFQKGSDELFLEFTNSEIIYNILSSDNMVASYTFPALCVGYLYAYISKRKYNFWSWSLYVIVLLTIYILWSATSLVGALLVILYIIFEGTINKFIAKLLNPRILFPIALFLLIGFTFLRIQELFSFIIVDLLGKTLTMTGRTNVWKIGLNGFNEEPFFGKGFNVQTIDNGLIQILFRGGIFSLFFLSIVFIQATKYIRKNYKLKLSKFYLLLISLIIIMSIAESWYFFFGFYVILALMNNIPYYKEKYLKYAG